MRICVLALTPALLLAGCMHYTRLTPSDFDRGRVSAVQFSRDNYDCRTKAVVRENMAQGGGDLRGVYNRAYSACMKKRGYASNNIELLGFGG